MGCRGECLSLPWFCLRKLQIVFSFTLLRLYRLVLYRGARNYETYPLETGKLKEIKLIYTLKVKENMLRKVSREEFLKRYEGVWKEYMQNRTWCKVFHLRHVYTD